MCQIIYRPTQHTLTLETLKACADENRDGWGIMYAEDGNVVVQNGMTWDSFLRTYQTIDEAQEMAIHFRWKTHGNVDLANTHPYTVLELERDGRDLQVMHNGIISIPQKHKNMSDTWHWVRGIVQPMIRKFPDLLEDKDSLELLENTIDGSRILFLDGWGKFTFLNRSYWHDEMGCEFSTSPPTPGGRRWSNGHYYEDYSEFMIGDKSNVHNFVGSAGANDPKNRGVWLKENGSYIFKKYEEDQKLLTCDEPDNTGVVVQHIDEGVSRLPYGTGEKYGQKAIDPDQTWFDESYFKGMGYGEILDVVNDHPEAVADLLYCCFA